MSETPHAPKGSFLRNKVAGVPVVYVAGGAVAILVVVAYKMKSTSATQQATQAAAGTDPNATDGTLSGAVPNLPTGTVVAPTPPPVDTPVPYSDNSTWMKQAVAYLISHGANPGAAQLAMQHYLGGADLTYAEGALRDQAVTQFGLPPDGFDAGNTAPKPPDPSLNPPPAPKPVPAPHPPSPPPPVHNPPPVHKPTPPSTKYVIVRPGDNLSSIAARYGKTWQQLYAIPANRQVIGSNPNLIKPGQRLVIP